MLSSSYYYTLYGAAGVRALPTTETIYGAILCGTDGEVEFSGVVKPSDAAGFFSIGAGTIPDVAVDSVVSGLASNRVTCATGLGPSSSLTAE